MAFAPIAMKIDLGAELAEELNIEEVFSFTLFGMKISIDEIFSSNLLILSLRKSSAFIYLSSN